MKRYENGHDLAKDMGISAEKLSKTFKDYTDCAKAKKDPFGKKFFQNANFHMNDIFHVAIMTPVLHYTMGGLEIDPESRVLGTDGKPIKGLFAAGEVAGGVHGANRLGGSSLLGCVVFGRVSGDSAAAYLIQSELGADGKAKGRLGAIAGQLGATPLSTTITVDPSSQKVDLTFSWAGSSASTSSAPAPSGSQQSSSPAPAPAPSSSTPTQYQQIISENILIRRGKEQIRNI